MKNKILLILIIIVELSANEQAMTQIPAKGADFPSLIGLRWGMTMNEARDSIAAKKEIQKATSETLSCEDTLLSTKAMITLKFIEKDKEMILDFIDIPLIEPTRELVPSVEKYLISRYGNQFESKKTKKTKFFITLEMEFKRWRLQNEEVGLLVCNSGEDNIGINLTYHNSKLK